MNLPPVIRVQRHGFVSYIEVENLTCALMSTEEEITNMDPVVMARFADFIAETNKVFAYVHRFVAVYKLLGRMTEADKTYKAHLLNQRNYLAYELRDYCIKLDEENSKDAGKEKRA
jgi:hypothetical protein